MIKWKIFHDNSLKNNPHLPKNTIFQWLQQNSYVRGTIFMYHSEKNLPTQLRQNAFLWRNFILYLQKMLFGIYLDGELCISLFFFFKFLKIYLFIYLFIFSCVGSSLLCEGFL